MGRHRVDETASEPNVTIDSIRGRISGVQRWRQLIASVAPGAKLRAPASLEDLIAVEAGIDVTLPGELRELLMECDGVQGSYGLDVIWPCARILEDNRMFRASKDFRVLYKQFSSLLFFGDAGNGDQCAYSIDKTIPLSTKIVVWNHEDYSRTWAAPGLVEYLEWSLTGKLTT